VLDVDGAKMILICYRWQTFDPEMIRFVGVDSTTEEVLAVKTAPHDRGRSMFPLDPEATLP
jgi:microcystin degradation protein MlrC